MTKADLIKFLEPFIDDIVITNIAGVNLHPYFAMDKSGEGYVVLSTNLTLVKGKPIEWK